MEFGALFLADPPPSRFVELAQRAEAAGFDYVWTADSHILWQEPWPLFALVARETERIRFGPLVTNPGTRDWTVLASLLATLNSLSGGRAVCGIGRGDSARRTIHEGPVRVAEFASAIPFIKDLAEGREVTARGKPLRIPWAEGQPVEMWGAGYGPKVLDVCGRLCDGWVLQLADPDILQWTRSHVLAGARAAGRADGTVRTMVAAPPYVTVDRAHAYDQLRWFAGSVANHIADLVHNYGGEDIPAVLTGYTRDRPEYDYAYHGKPNNPRTDYVPDEINERFCVIGTAEEHVAKLGHLETLGMDVFTGYFIHDDIEGTLAAYGAEVIPALR